MVEDCAIVEEEAVVVRQIFVTEICLFSVE
jgi:hypothetical protein